MRENTIEDKFSVVLKGSFQKIAHENDSDQGGEVKALYVKDYWGEDSLFRPGQVSNCKVVCKKSGSIIISLSSVDFR